MNLSTMKKLKGKAVLDQGARHIGTLTDVEIATDRWSVEAIIVSLDRNVLEKLGVDKPLFGKPQIRIGTSQVKSAGDSVLLSVDLSTLAYGLLTHESDE